MEIREALLDPDHPHVTQIKNNLGTLYNRTGRHEQAVPLLAEVVAAHRRHGLEPADLGAGLSNYGTALHRSGRPAEAIDALRESEAIFSELQGSDAVVLAFPRQILGDALAALGRSEEAEAVYRAALDVRERGLPEDHPERGVHPQQAGDVPARRGTARRGRGAPRAGPRGAHRGAARRAIPTVWTPASRSGGSAPLRGAPRRPRTSCAGPSRRAPQRGARTTWARRGRGRCSRSSVAERGRPERRLPSCRGHDHPRHAPVEGGEGQSCDECGHGSLLCLRERAGISTALQPESAQEARTRSFGRSAHPRARPCRTPAPVIRWKNAKLVPSPTPPNIRDDRGILTLGEGRGAFS
jgi:hypothetical protein